MYIPTVVDSFLLIDKMYTFIIDPDKEILFSYPSILTCVLGAQKNSLIEMVLLCTHSIYLVEK